MICYLNFLDKFLQLNNSKLLAYCADAWHYFLTTCLRLHGQRKDSTKLYVILLRCTNRGSIIKDKAEFSTRFATPTKYAMKNSSAIDNSRQYLSELIFNKDNK